MSGEIKCQFSVGRLLLYLSPAEVLCPEDCRFLAEAFNFIFFGVSVLVGFILSANARSSMSMIVSIALVLLTLTSL